MFLERSKADPSGCGPAGQPLRILLVAGTLSGRGGIETCLRTVAQEAIAAGDALRILALCPSTDDSSWHAGLDYAEVKEGHPSLKRQALKGIPALVKEMRSRPFDAVVVIYSSTIPLVRLALMLAGLRRPVLAWLHFSTMIKQRTGLLRLAQAQICISRQFMQEMQALKGVRADSVHLVHNGTDVRVAPVGRSTDGALRFVHVGRLMVGGQKRSDDLLRALGQVQGNWSLDMVGAGSPPEALDSLQSLAQELGIAQRVRWKGWQRDPWAAMDCADVLVLCSEFEGLPLVLIEAMARGIACASTDCVAGPSDIVVPGTNGWLFPVGSVEALAQRLQGLVDRREPLPPPEEVRASVQKFSRQEMYRNFRRVIVHTSDARARRRGLAAPMGE